MLEIFKMIIISFLIDNKIKRPQFSKESFLFAIININVALKIPFFNLSNIKINFIDYELN